MEATTKDLRLRTRQLLAAVQRGESVTITFHGEPTAMLMPLTRSRTATGKESNPAFGMWRDAGANESVDAQLRRLRRPREHR